MPCALSLMYNKFIEIQANGDKFLDEDFILKIFETFYTQLPEIEMHLTFYFEEKESNIFGSCKQDDCVLAINGDVAEIFYPCQMENKQIKLTCRELAVKLATGAIAKCIHPKNAIHD